MTFKASGIPTLGATDPELDGTSTPDRRAVTVTVRGADGSRHSHRVTIGQLQS